MIITHVVLESFWNNYIKKESYGDAALKEDGFIHCSTIDTTLEVANSNFKDCGPMLLLVIDADKVVSSIKWEDLEKCGTKFPHIYGPLNKNAIIDILPFNKNNNQNFYLPIDLDKYI